MLKSLLERVRQQYRLIWWQSLLVLIFLAMIILASSSETAATLSISLIVISFAILLLNLRKLIRFDELDDRRLWQLVVTAIAMWALARVYEAGSLVLVGEMPPIPTLANLFRLAGFLAMTGGLASLPISKGKRFSRVRDLVDALIVIIGSLVLFYLIVIQTAMEVGFESPVAILWAGIPPAFDLTLALLSFRLRLLAQTKIERKYLGLLALAFFVRLPSDLAIGYGLLRPERMLGHLSDLGWLLSPMALMLSSNLRIRDHENEVQPEKVPPTWKRMASRVETLMPPFIAYLVAGITLVNYWLLGEVNWVGIGSSAVLGVLLVARQGVITGQLEMSQQAALVDAAADLAFICDSQGELLLANPSMRKATGIALDMEQIQLSDLLASGDPDEILKQGVEGGWSGEVDFLDSSGRPFLVALSLRPVPDERSHQLKLAATAHDLTKLKRREDELRQALHEIADARQELEALNQSLEQKVQNRTQELAETVDHLEKLNEELKELDRLKSEFVTLVSHELRGPLTNIRSGVELALSRAETLPESAEEILSLVSAETERLSTFVEIILDLSALEAGRFPLDIKPIPLAVLTRAVASRFPEDKRSRIKIDLDEDMPAIMADEQALTSVLFHLLDNALKYAPQGPVEIKAERMEDQIQIVVADHGPGIPPEERQSVFDRFHRLDTRDSREIYGHGLGLYLSRQLLRAMHGNIEVAEYEHGAKIQFLLPLEKVRQPQFP